MSQEDFLNTAVCGDVSLEPHDLLHAVKDVERRLGRVQRFRWGPREIDIDLIFYDQVVLRDNMLEVPHPRCHGRDFVLRPVMDLAPTFRHPVLGRTVAELYAALPEDSRAVLATVPW